MKNKVTTISILIMMLFLSFSNLFGQENLIINEFMAVNNKSLQDEDNTYSDWIEIFNSSTLPINLSGWCLTDDSTNYSKWKFPNIDIDPNEYLIVFASDKDRFAEKDKLHTNFKLSGSGEFLALSNPGTSIYSSEFRPAFPEQYDNVSYALQNGVYNYSNDPTPGAENDVSLYVAPVKYSNPHDFYNTTFNLALTSEQTNAKIYYTTDASTPTITNGTLYTDPISISKTTVVRAVAVINGTLSSQTTTSSFIFPQDVFNQFENQPGYPSTWLQPTSYLKYEEISTHYGMNSSVLKMAAVSDNLITSIKSLPIVSIVTDIDNLFSKDMDSITGGIYMYSGESDGSTSSLKYHLGRGWERPASVEYFNSSEDSTIDFQENCGLKIHGGASRSTRKTVKRSFKIGFKSAYGSTKLKEKLFGKGSPKQYDRLILRGGFDDRLENQVVDPWVKSAMRDMDQYAGRSKFVQLYLNGMYWGMYNLSEQMDENCMRDNLGGKAEDYDIIKDYYEVEAGNSDAWDLMVSLASQVKTKPENYQRIIGNKSDGTPDASIEKLLNPENLADYILDIMYNNPWDWDKHNWAAARRRTNSEGFHFLVWDAESGLTEGNKVTTTMNEPNSNRPSSLFVNLMKNQDFKNIFISRVNRNYFEDGALTPDPGLVRYKKILSEIDTALIGDQARWYANTNDIWNIEQHAFIDDYLSNRSEDVFNQFIAAGIYPRIDKPSFNTNSSRIPENFELLMTSPEGAEIRYTLDGTDPGHYSLESSNSILIYDNGALKLPEVGEKLTIFARTKQDTLWSPLVKKTFTIDKKTNVDDRLITEEIYPYCYPNPVQDYTNISYSLTETAHVSLKVYNMLGEYITTLTDGNKEQGDHVIKWNSENYPAGIYFCILDNINIAKRYRIIMIKE